jgi:nucleotide-binding universal stress UspA family protein
MTDTGTDSRTGGPQPLPRGIVVGHDGSRGAAEALSEALGLASALGVPVTVVRAWSLTTAPRPDGWEFGYVPSFDECGEAVRVALVEDVHDALAAHQDVAVDYRVAHAGASKALVEISEGARMLVVGARGVGGLAGMLLGSVSEQCVRHARCPVLVVKSHE